MAEISVVVPIYNVKKYLDRLISSIMEQSYVNWELILVDDGSTDRVKSAIRSYEKSDSRIKSVLRPKNGGASVARKAGFENASGKYICFFDADDWIENTMLEKMHTYLEKYDADMVCCGYYEEYANKQIQKHFEERTDICYFGQEAIKELLRRKNVLSHPWNKMYRKEILDMRYFMKRKSMGEDYFMIIGALRNAQKVVQFDLPLYHYVLRKGSTLDEGFNEFYRNGFYSYKKIEQVLLHFYPAFRNEVTDYHLVEEMAIMASMFKRDHYDEKILRQIISDIRKNHGKLFIHPNVEIKFKISAACICIDYRILRLAYRKLFQYRTKNKM